MATDSGEKYTFFWKSDDPFSQWHMCAFSVSGVTYNCAEQYMMHQKALLFGDQEIADRIMRSNKPREQKALGRKVKNFDEGVWTRKCQDIVKAGSMAKFSQNEDILQQLLATQSSVLVEASPHDRIWGIGLTMDSPNAQSKSTWEGQNLLGYILTDVREELIKTRQEEQH